MNIDKAIKSALENHRAGNFQQAEILYRKILKQQPNDVDALHLLGVLCHQRRDYDSAIKYIRKAIQLDAGFAEAYNNLGNVMRDKGMIDEAETCYQSALRIHPNFAIAYNNLGNIYTEKKLPDKAVPEFQKALQINPNFTEAYNNLGKVFSEKNKHDDAISCFQKALRINPDSAEAYVQLTYEMQQICNWQDLGAMTAKCDDLTRKALEAGTKPAETPFMSISRKIDPSVNLAVAEAWSRDTGMAVANLGIHFTPDIERKGKTKIAVGYLSDRFGDTATAHLMLSLFGLHSRDEFEIFCYSYGRDDGSHYRSRIQHDSDKFLDISNLSYIAAARRIYEDRVDILVDLKGYTRGNRLEICALRPAPIQVSYLVAYTTGAGFTDYIITDKIATPEDQCRYFSEKFVYMPHCYLVNDHNQTIADVNWKWGDFGLPEDCFVFSSFNQTYKIDPVTFDIWMKILKRVPESILWLLYVNNAAKENLRREAEARGVKSERLIFAEKLPKDRHLARLRFADLALDTRIVNGHTTTSDALWAGLPVITLQGRHFASRVSSSMLSALGVPELITYSLEQYEALAVKLAHDPAELGKTRQRIAENRLKMPLFDTPLFVKNLETAYKEMVKISVAGEAPRQIEVMES
jgi:protein O-GlcNAc transferase